MKIIYENCRVKNSMKEDNCTVSFYQVFNPVMLLEEKQKFLQTFLTVLDNSFY